MTRGLGQATLGYYAGLTRMLATRRPPKTAAELPHWHLAQAVLLWNQVCRVEGDTFAQYVARSGVRLPKWSTNSRVAAMTALYTWPILAGLVARRHGSAAADQWRHEQHAARDHAHTTAQHHHAVVAHMNDGSVLITDVHDGSVLKELKGIPTARGVVAADDVGITFVTSSPNQLMLIDSRSLTEIKRVTTGRSPDGVAWDKAHKMVGVSDQKDGALSLIADSGSGVRRSVPLGVETGNVVYDATRGWFWITVVTASPPDQVVAVEPLTAKVATTIKLPGCSGAHGLRLHPDGKTALIACEGNDLVARVDLDGEHAIATGKTSHGPDVLAIDPGLGWLYVASEGGDLTVFDILRPGVVLIGHDHPGDNAHTVAIDPATHRVFFPLPAGPKGTPVMRIMRPGG